MEPAAAAPVTPAVAPVAGTSAAGVGMGSRIAASVKLTAAAGVASRPAPLSELSMSLRRSCALLDLRRWLARLERRLLGASAGAGAGSDAALEAAAAATVGLGGGAPLLCRACAAAKIACMPRAVSLSRSTLFILEESPSSSVVLAELATRIVAAVVVAASAPAPNPVVEEAGAAALRSGAPARNSAFARGLLDMVRLDAVASILDEGGLEAIA